MKNWLNWGTLTWEAISHMTNWQRVILIGSIILPAGSLILIFSRYGQQIIAKLTKARTLKTFGNWCKVYEKGINLNLDITEDDIKKDLYERTKE